MSKEQIDVCIILFCLFLSQKRKKYESVLYFRKWRATWISPVLQKMEDYLNQSCTSENGGLLESVLFFRKWRITWISPVLQNMEDYVNLSCTSENGGVFESVLYFRKWRVTWLSPVLQKMEGYLKLILINFHVSYQSESIKFSNNNMMGNYVGM